MAHTDYSKMEANHKARRSAEKQDMHKERVKVRISLAKDLDWDSVTFPIRLSDKRCPFCKTPGFWCCC